MDQVMLMALAVLVTSLCSGLRHVPRGFTGLVERRGSYRRPLRTRVGWVVPGAEDLVLVDLRSHRGSLGPLPLSSGDPLPLVATVGFRYRVVDPVPATYRSQSVRSSVEHLTRHELQMMLAGLPAEAIIEPAQAQALRDTLARHLERAEGAWGIRVDEVTMELCRLDEYDATQRIA